ncbi:MAG: hypothetical protein HeimC2_41160 [Candidatus Heimdallarchaeota archaeon LC_2]|nr:MAG: hypothetical protein HeimC2_41160 [Candidatus Heimdallarchaeota archaeon LC_2]
MTLKEVHDFISHGFYDKALESMESDPDDLKYIVCKSRIKELNGHFEEAITIARGALNQAIMTFDNIAVINAISALAYGLWRVYNFEGALNYINQASDYFNKHDESIDYKIALGTLHNIHGLILWKNNNLDISLTEFSTGLEYREQVGELSPVSYSLNNMGNAYLSMGHLDYSEKYFQDAQKIRIELGTKPGIASSYNSLARLYDVKQKYNQAQEYHEKSLKLWKEVGNYQFIAKSYRFLGIHYLSIRDVEKANKYLQDALDLFQTIRNNIDYEITRNLLPTRS